MAKLSSRQFTLGHVARSLRSFWLDGRTMERVCYVVGTLLLASGLIHLLILIVSGASWLGPLSLRKAMTFGLSFGLTLITIGWVSSFLEMRDRMRTALLGAFTAASVLETTLVSMQAWRGVPSHFNLATTFDGIIARTLAAGGAGLVAVIVALAIVSFRRNASVPDNLRIAIRSGFVILLGSMAVGGLMIAKGMQLALTGHAAAAYATGGTLKPAHAVMMHAILVLPLVAWLMTLTGWTERAQRRVVLVAVGGYAVCAGLVTIANLTVWHVRGASRVFMLDVRRNAHPADVSFMKLTHGRTSTRLITELPRLPSRGAAIAIVATLLGILWLDAATDAAPVQHLY